MYFKRYGTEIAECNECSFSVSLVSQLQTIIHGILLWRRSRRITTELKDQLNYTTSHLISWPHLLGTYIKLYWCIDGIVTTALTSTLLPHSDFVRGNVYIGTFDWSTPDWKLYTLHAIGYFKPRYTQEHATHILPCVVNRFHYNAKDFNLPNVE